MTKQRTRLIILFLTIMFPSYPHGHRLFLILFKWGGTGTPVPPPQKPGAMPHSIYQHYSDSTKTATSNRKLPLTAFMRAYLQKVKAQQSESKELLGSAYQNSGFVCVYADGSPIRPDFVTPHFQRILKQGGLPVIRFHDLRHSAVYALRKGGCDAKDIQTWLGHSDVSTPLNIYGHLLGGDMERLGKVMDSLLFQEAKAG